MKRIVVVGMFLSLLLSGFSFAQSDRRDEIQQLLTSLESTSQLQRVKAAKIISRGGLNDESLYLKIAEIIKAGYLQMPEKALTDEVSWMCKALAASGDMKHKELLDTVAADAKSMKVQRYAKQSSELFDRYVQRNQILNSAENWDDELSAEENRLLNMLRSDDVVFKRDAAKIIVRKLQVDPKVYTAVSATLTQMTENFDNEHVYVDTIAWLCQALAASGDSQYLATLENLRETVSNTKVRTFAKKGIKALEKAEQ